MVIRYYNPLSVSSSGFPFYNVVRVDENTSRLDFALAGFDEQDLEIEVKEGNLFVFGKKIETTEEYLHKGISTASFKKGFRLPEHAYVDTASMKNGVLSITVKVEVPERLKPVKIAINKS